MISPTYGEVNIDKVMEIMKKFYDSVKGKDAEAEFEIIVGTDSQNFSANTKMVVVVAMVSEGHGGIYFYDIKWIGRVSDVRTKLHIETQESLEMADKIIYSVEEKEEITDMFADCGFSIHVDAGKSRKGKTRELIPELVGWINACGFSCRIKPESYVASGIANAISK